MAKPVLKKIVDEADGVYQSILRKRKPKMHMPVRALANVRYSPKVGYFELTGKRKRDGW